ncbi:tRNA 5-methoxyuridine(34)/uridine 5-oxyacetic acid(34) synthase CmoB [Methylococcus geothermalis]|uniref:tRNA U34 carboxymethyltransferase n=1 Tax=Methylococcus geothermalis TaxID=2681310 RepID=A0A858Q459_9GAMM|nr:tRNA 5-methoxyuridine(34)/uridine 5-oxyacetic acid(34) synthase CmoB [Methylococcus geothermalis]QJD28604.1 tRNA 5-methoxyuridine(34)/uridine 5-oxyacetic acid(34) synthase CmoB [Methylococcus geothermalis]
MSDRELFAGLLAPRCFPGWAEILLPRIEAALAGSRHGNWPRWRALLQDLPEVAPSAVDFAADTVSLGRDGDCDRLARQAIESALRRLHPWRKGPYDIHGIVIDTEWRSDLKWRRLQHAIAPLAGRRVLDVGCGNGYHAWRMLGAGAKAVIGIDPTLLSVAQFLAVRHFAGDWPVAVLPLGIEDFPSETRVFDTVFSMGVLYHRRSPFDHLAELKGCLRPGGELVLETLVIEGEAGQVLVPEGRYAQMRNVWFIPSPPTLLSWLARAGYRDVRLVDVSPTTIQEQRSTGWMQFQSLPDFLDPEDSSRTVEGHPAPRRAIFLAEAP